MAKIFLGDACGDIETDSCIRRDLMETKKIALLTVVWYKKKKKGKKTHTHTQTSNLSKSERKTVLLLLASFIPG
jgi:hypothetical protein